MLYQPLGSLDGWAEVPLDRKKIAQSNRQFFFPFSFPFRLSKLGFTGRAATASGGLGILFVTAVPAMYRLGLLDDPSKDIGKLIALTACAGFFGVFFVIPLRKYYIVHQKLTFPTPAATASLNHHSITISHLSPFIQAYTIRSLHRGRTGAIAARKKSLALLYSFAVVFVFKVLTGYAPGIVRVSFCYVYTL